MIRIFFKLRNLLDIRERQNAVLLFGMMLIMGLLDALGVVSIMPFIAVVSNPDVINSNKYLKFAFDQFGFNSTDDFLLFLGVTVFIILMGSLTFKALVQWAMARYSHMRNYSLSIRLLRGYLGQPYSWFLDRHSADLGATVLSEVGHVISQALMPAVQLIANSIVALCIIVLVLLVEPMVALVAMVVLGGTYAIIYIALRGYLSWIGTDRLRANEQRFQIAQEALGGIKDVKVLGLEDGYLRAYSQPAHRFARRQAMNQIIAQVPRFILEGLAFGGMIAIVLILLASSGGDVEKVIPLVAMYAFAGYRLIPALQQIYYSLTELRFSAEALDKLHRDLVITGGIGWKANRKPDQESIERLPLRESLCLSDVSFTYPNSKSPALVSLNICIPAKTTIAFVGTTGAGKTTAVDLILGLLRPQSGELRVDQIPIADDNVRAWQRNLGYVPQHIFLSDDTVSANIAFGVPEHAIDKVAVENAAHVAELHDFIVNEMLDAYDTKVGERGVRLSGGQRQRIGIARALYHNPDVLILDEATSALDNLTEKAVMRAVHNLGHRKTIILIAHRLSTVRNCDLIFVFEKGQVTSIGTYAELMSVSQAFRAMVTSSDQDQNGRVI